MTSKIIYTNYQSVEKCEENNGGCNHTCTDTQNGTSCSCHNGYRLLSDGTSCEGKTTLIITAVEFMVLLLQISMNVSLIREDVPMLVPIQMVVIPVDALWDMSFKLTIMTALKVSCSSKCMFTGYRQHFSPSFTYIHTAKS